MSLCSFKFARNSVGRPGWPQTCDPSSSDSHIVGLQASLPSKESNLGPVVVRETLPLSYNPAELYF